MQTDSFDRSRINLSKATQSLSKRWLYVLLIIVLMMGIFFRFANLDKKVYWNDEAVTSLRISGYTEAEIVEQVYDRNPINVSEFLKYQSPTPQKNLGDVINSLATEDAHLSLLYHVMTRLWVDLFGSSIAAVRSFSAVISLLAFPCLYWLCRELFNSSLTGWVGMALLAVSPFHVLYAQEARQYSLWTVTILLSSAALLRALRVQNKVSWIIYAATVALGIYAHTLSILVIIGHGIYVAIAERFRLSKLITFFLWTVIGLSTYIPWLLIVFNRLSKVTSNVSRTNIDMSFLALAKSWGQSLNRIFIDIPNLGDYIFPLSFLLTIVAIYYLTFKSQTKTHWMILALIGTVLFLAIPDLVLGGKRSSDSRYLIPTFLGIQLAVAYFLTFLLTSNHHRLQHLGKAIAVFCLTGGIISCAVSSQAQTWWNKYSAFHNPTVAEFINQYDNPLVISDNTPGRVLSLSYLLNEDAKLMLRSQAELPTISENFTNIFIFQASSKLQKKLEKSDEYNFLKVVNNNLLQWKK
jgi:uncharacterized membrane protein